MIGRSRKYVSGTRWCVWRFTDTDSEYIVRLHVLKTPWFALCLHRILKPDPEPYLHDHPVSFLSIILRGGYTEHRVRSSSHGVLRTIRHRWFNFIRATPEDRHTICDVEPGTVTLCLMGPKVRDWGFHAERGWVHWKSYYTKQRAERAVSTIKRDEIGTFLTKYDEYLDGRRAYADLPALRSADTKEKP